MDGGIDRVCGVCLKRKGGGAREEIEAFRKKKTKCDGDDTEDCRQ